ncbi:MAG: hypothetical protein AAGA48_36715 [Myxococcota bacterium]
MDGSRWPDRAWFIFADGTHRNPQSVNAARVHYLPAEVAISDQLGRFKSLILRLRSALSSSKAMPIEKPPSKPVPEKPKPPLVTPRKPPSSDGAPETGRFRELTQDLKAKFNVQRQSLYDHPTTLAFLVSLLGRDREDTRSRISQTFPRAFRVEEPDLNRVDRAIRAHLFGHADVVRSSPTNDVIRFVAEARYINYQTQVFTRLADLLGEGGTDRNPHRLTVSWTSPLRLPPGDSAEVRMEFTTGPHLTNGHDPASIRLAVISPDRKWVRTTFEKLRPSLEALQIGGVARPLQIFENAWFVGSVAYVASVSVGIGTAYAVLGAFLATSPGPVALLLAGMTFFVIVSAGPAPLGQLLPRLVPASHIRIGHAGKQAERFEATFKYLSIAALLILVLLPALQAC